MKKILSIILLCFLRLTQGLSLSMALLFIPQSIFADLQDDVNSAIGETISGVQTAGTRDIDYVDVAHEVQFWVFVVIGLIAVGYIVYIGARLIWAPGNMEELSSSVKALAYVVLGLAIIPFAYFLVQFIVSLRLN
jgi:hypothetical protein